MEDGNTSSTASHDQQPIFKSKEFKMSAAFTITSAFAATVDAIHATGKTCWIIVNEDYLVGAYASRTEARNAKTEGNLVGTILKASDVEFKIVDLTKPTEVAKAAKTPKAEKIDPRNLTVCPVCGSTELYAGRVNKIAGSGFGTVVDEDTVGGCHHCDWSYDLSISHKSEIESPCFVVWDTADKMVGARRKDVIAACVEKGVAFYTARTQYQLWFNSKKNG
jgi:hypothetical protein